MATAKKAPEAGAAKNRETIRRLNMSVGNLARDDYPAPKSSGVKTRSNGAATKGVTARGPMA